MSGHFISQVLFEMHRELSPVIEAIVRAAPSPERLFAAQSVAQAVLTCQAVDALSIARQHTIAFANLRSVEETASNLYYALYAGPTEESRTPKDLAEQFLAYRDWDHRRVVNKLREMYREKFRQGWIPTDGAFQNGLADFEAFCDAVIVKGDNTKQRYPKMDRGSWHTTDKESRSAKALDHLPAFVPKHVREAWESVHLSTSLFNTILHGGPMLFEVDVAKIPLGTLLTPKNDEAGDLNWSVMSAQLGRACWLALGDQCGVLQKVEEAWDRLYVRHLLNIQSKQEFSMKRRWPMSLQPEIPPLMRRPPLEREGA